MASRTVHGGDLQIGLLDGLQEEAVEALVAIDADGALITVPQDKPIFESAGDGSMDSVPLSPHPSPVPDVLWFRGTEQSYALLGCHAIGSSMVFGGNRLSHTKIRANRLVVGAAAHCDYRELNGLETKIEGLASWSGMGAVSTSIDRTDPVFPSVLLRGQNMPSHELGGPLNATLSTSFSHRPEPWGEIHQIRETLHVGTRTRELVPSADHRRVHIMLQDLMCLVFGRAVSAEATAVMREDDQPCKDGSDKRLWREVYEPGFGRHAEGLAALNLQHNPPLFHLSDTQPDHVTVWMENWELWSRPTSIAVTTLFQSGTTAEAEILQIAVALEALGYAILVDDGRRPGELDNVQQALKAIFNRVRWNWRSILGEKSTEWAERFRIAYNGVKHANNPLPEPLAAHRLAQQGLTVMRVWQAHQLGAPESVVLASLGVDA